MLCATPVFAAGKAYQTATETADVMEKVTDGVTNSGHKVLDLLGDAVDKATGQDQGKVNVSVNTLNNTKVIADDQSTVKIGNLENPGGWVNTSVNTIGDSTISATKESHVRIGNQTNSRGWVNASVNTIGGNSELSASQNSRIEVGNIDRQ